MQSLYEAFRAGDRERADTLVAADPTLAIFTAALFGDAAEIEKLLGGNRSLVNAVSSDGWLPLHLAAHFGHADAARVLLNKGAQVNARSTNALQNMALHVRPRAGPKLSETLTGCRSRRQRTAHGG